MRKKSTASKLVLAALAALAAGALAILLALSNLGSPVDRAAYDLCLGLRKGSPAPASFLVVAPSRVGAVAKLGAGDALDTLRILDEFGASGLVLSGRAFIGAREGEELALVRRELPAAVDRETGGIEANFRALIAALRAGSLPPGSLPAFVEDFAGMIKASGTRIKEAAGSQAGLAALDAEMTRLSVRKRGLPAASASSLPADPDGILRSLPLLEGGDGDKTMGSSPAAALDAFLPSEGKGRLALAPGRVLLRDAGLPGSAARSFSLPVDGSGHALVAWPGTEAACLPRQLSFGDFLDLSGAEEAFVSLLERMDSAGLLVSEGGALMSRWRHATRLLEDRDSGEAVSSADWREARADFYAAATAYFAESYEDGLHAAVEVARERSSLSEGDLAALDERDLLIDSSFAEARSSLARLTALRERFASEIRGSLVFLSAETVAAPAFAAGTAAASPALANAVFAASVVDGRVPRRATATETALLAGFLAAASLALVLALRRHPLFSGGLVLLVALVGAGLSPLLFAVLGIYFPPLSALAGSLASGLSALVLLRRGRIERRVRKARGAVVAWKALDLARAPEGLEAKELASRLAAFRSAVGSAVASQGGRLAASDSGSALAFFEEGKRKGSRPASERALAAILEAGEAEPLLLAGLDSGECVLSRPFPRGGLRLALAGAPVDLALRLADLNLHYGSRTLASGYAFGASSYALGAASGEWTRLGEIRSGATGRKAEFFAMGKLPEKEGREAAIASP